MPNPNEYLAKKSLLDTKQDLLTAGANITIDNNNVISAAGGTEVEANPQNPATDTLTTIDIDGTVYDIPGSGGSSVIPNPSDPPTDTLDSIEIDGDIFSVGGGADVEANPQDTPSDTLSTIGIDGVVYEIEGGGGGSDVVVDPTITSGTKIADITVDGDTSSLYAPEVSLTYAEYMALTEQEKNNGTTYYITDMDAGSINIFAPVIYSKYERKIGVWIDDKPLYQKTMTYQFTNTNDVYHDFVPDANAYIVNAIGLIDAGGNVTRPIPIFYNNSVSSTHARFDEGAPANGVRLRRESGAWGATPTAIVTLQYTKTTDIEGSGSWTNSGAPTTHITYNTPFDTGKRINNKIVYGYYNISSDVPRADWNNCSRELTGLPSNNITMTHWDIKYLTNNNVWWQKGEANDSLYISQGAGGAWYVTCYWTYSGASTCKIYTYVEFIIN